MAVEQDCVLTEEDFLILTLLTTYPSDEPIARHLDVSVRTVRRRVARIMEILDVQNRFAAGVAAAHLGWVAWGHNERQAKGANIPAKAVRMPVKRFSTTRIHSN
ncbi:LuxR C-terminal-related transcriptional regulator [Streptomyces termitum]|uniref:HTH luxR-type domain-containing protein n=1 Tax=Streptomyces termitum TaxID=67368 RepID=A0A918WA28_9ACTN|nr:LuxR C-terminal-related transcriptional regulator [Streptomyces termitum]GHA94671.1 hypothetical protein GCM10010305_42820 [Streptomyces termitum]